MSRQLRENDTRAIDTSRNTSLLPRPPVHSENICHLVHPRNMRLELLNHAVIVPQPPRGGCILCRILDNPELARQRLLQLAIPMVSHEVVVHDVLAIKGNGHKDLSVVYGAERSNVETQLGEELPDILQEGGAQVPFLGSLGLGELAHASKFVGLHIVHEKLLQLVLGNLLASVRRLHPRITENKHQVRGFRRIVHPELFGLLVPPIQ
mmetsp:Transcript_17751/g.42676  ORF Transcript_17751/g.42676 Transcript_17751/m.42676 type:complete len:208 (-) Transcript_17751:451-1074(-)